jgi:hypothetical protein
MRVHQVRGQPAERLRGEGGAALVIALIFLIIGSFIVLTLTNLTGVNLTDTFQLQGERAVEYATDGGIDGAIEAFRYNQPVSGCESDFSAPFSYAAVFAPATPLSEDGAPYLAAVSCALMTPGTGSSTKGSSVVLHTNSSSPPCIPQDIGQSVSDPIVQGNILPATVVTGCSGSDWQISNPATAFSSNTVSIGTTAQRLVTFYGCSAEASSLSGCTPSQAVITATVLFYNTDAQGNLDPGYRALVESWVVNKANG